MAILRIILSKKILYVAKYILTFSQKSGWQKFRFLHNNFITHLKTYIFKMNVTKLISLFFPCIKYLDLFLYMVSISSSIGKKLFIVFEGNSDLNPKIIVEAFFWKTVFISSFGVTKHKLIYIKCTKKGYLLSKLFQFRYGFLSKVTIIIMVTFGLGITERNIILESSLMNFGGFQATLLVDIELRKCRFLIEISTILLA